MPLQELVVSGLSQAIILSNTKTPLKSFVTVQRCSTDWRVSTCMNRQCPSARAQQKAVACPTPGNRALKKGASREPWALSVSLETTRTQKAVNVREWTIVPAATMRTNKLSCESPEPPNRVLTHDAPASSIPIPEVSRTVQCHTQCSRSRRRRDRQITPGKPERRQYSSQLHAIRFKSCYFDCIYSRARRRDKRL